MKQEYAYLTRSDIDFLCFSLPWSSRLSSPLILCSLIFFVSIWVNIACNQDQYTSRELIQVQHGKARIAKKTGIDRRKCGKVRYQDAGKKQKELAFSLISTFLIFLMFCGKTRLTLIITIGIVTMKCTIQYWRPWHHMNSTSWILFIALHFAFVLSSSSHRWVSHLYFLFFSNEDFQYSRLFVHLGFGFSVLDDCFE